MKLNRFGSLCTIFSLLIQTSCQNGIAESLSYEEIRRSNVFFPDPEMIDTNDNIHLALYSFQASSSRTSLLFIHGGGAHSGAGYGTLAAQLQSNGVSVYLLDLRGHGKSQGPRGDTPSVDQIMEDVSSVINIIRERNTEAKLILGGHSSGGGLVLNYATWEKRLNIDGYLFVSPELGYMSQTARPEREEFARTNKMAFIINAITGGRLLGNTKAVDLNYPEYILQENPLLISELTCNMAHALTPSDPRKQFSLLDRPFAILIGEDDELFLPDAVIAYANSANTRLRYFSTTEIIPGKKHLSILFGIDASIMKAIDKF